MSGMLQSLLQSLMGQQMLNPLQARAAEHGMLQPVSTYGQEQFFPGDLNAMASLAQQAAGDRWQRQTGTLYQGDPGMNIMGVPNAAPVDPDPFGMGDQQGAEYANMRKQQRQDARASSARQPGAVSGGGSGIGPARPGKRGSEIVGFPSGNTRAIPSGAYLDELESRKALVRERGIARGMGMQPMQYRMMDQVMQGGLDSPAMAGMMFGPEGYKAALVGESEQANQEFLRSPAGIAMGIARGGNVTGEQLGPLMQAINDIQNNRSPASGDTAGNDTKLNELWTENEGDFSYIPFNGGNEDSFVEYAREKAIPPEQARAFYRRVMGSQGGGDPAGQGSAPGIGASIQQGGNSALDAIRPMMGNIPQVQAAMGALPVAQAAMRSSNLPGQAQQAMNFGMGMATGAVPGGRYLMDLLQRIQ